ncbi:MAG: hypothetical protein ACYCZB_16460 [Acidiphilium sp.]
MPNGTIANPPVPATRAAAAAMRVPGCIVCGAVARPMIAAACTATGNASRRGDSVAIARPI